MKDYPIVVLVLCFFSAGQFLFAHNSSITSSPSSTFSTTYTDKESIENALLSNIWYQGDLELHFAESGIVSITDVKNAQRDSRAWRLEKSGNTHLLRIANGKCDELIYRIEKDGDRYQWINTVTNLPVEVNAAPFEMKAERTKVHQSLIGTWRSSIYPSTVIENLKGLKDVTIMSADFKYILEADGSFRKIVYINREQYFVANGLWQLSEDSKELVLHFLQDDCSYTTRSAEIKLIALDELVLGQALAFSDLEEKICEKRKTFFYNKQ
ncbi:MAG: hypothetical protein AAF849_08800 [Bacteroidota bacterium]